MMQARDEMDDALLILELSRQVTSSLRMQDVLDRSLTGLRMFVTARTLRRRSGHPGARCTAGRSSSDPRARRSRSP
jgi:hypothetical protein